MGSGSTVSQISLADLRGIAGELDMQFGAGLQETLADVVKLEKEVAPRRRAALDTMRVRFEEENPELDSSFADYRLFDDRVAAIRADLDREREEINEYGVVTKARGVKYDLAKMFDLIEQTILEYPPDVLAAKIAEKRSDETATPFPPSVEQLVVDLHMESELNDPIQFNADEIERELAELDAMMLELTPENRATYAQRRDELDKSLSALKSGVLARDDIYRFWFTSCLTKLSDELMTLRLIQARARLETIELAIVDVQPTLAFQVARERRLDWMNQRASLVDEWRNIGIVADQLRSDMRLSFDATTRNEGSNPLDFSARNTTLNVGVKFDAPLDRFLERNSYRRALISYDRARRNYYAYVDDVHQQIRSAIRSIQLAQISFELQRDSVLTSIKQVHSAQLALTKPPTGSSKVGSVNTSAEALVNALQSLLNSQNEIMQTWLQYQSQRMNLMLLLGIFHLDETGRWIDPGSIDANLIHSELAGATQTQDELAGMSNLPSFEQLSGGRTPDEIRQLGSEDLESLPAVPEGAARAVSGVPSASGLNAPLANAAVGTDVPMVATLSPR
ncbi:MAG: TolC family protein [Thermoguttaceae bacterium]|nr:TolC family protein [Thermoguttaceae bacterium]